VPRLCKFYPGICLTTEEKARKNLSQVKKSLSQSTVYILPKNTHTLQHLLPFPYNNGCTNAPQCHVIRTLPVLLNVTPGGTYIDRWALNGLLRRKP